MNHALLGASLPFAIAALVYVARGCRASLPLLVLAPLAMAALALWASAPDIPRVLGLHDLYLRLSIDPRMDLFLWHHALDQVETESRWHAVGLVIMAGALIAAALRELRLREAP